MEREAAKLRLPDDSSGLELHQASCRGEIYTVKQLVETENVNPLLKDEDGDTALHWAAEGGGLSVMKFFIEDKGLSPACQGQYGQTALHIANILNWSNIWLVSNRWTHSIRMKIATHLFIHLA